MFLARTTVSDFQQTVDDRPFNGEVLTKLEQASRRTKIEMARTCQM
jgi:hypothetical protein